MKNLFKYAAVHWKSLLAIIAILFIQAYCDLSLPAYTSDIVNVGIQQGGIEDQIPEALAADEMEKLLLFVPSVLIRHPLHDPDLLRLKLRLLPAK